MAVRMVSSKLYFYDLHQGGKHIQLMANAKYHADAETEGALNGVHEKVYCSAFE